MNAPLANSLGQAQFLGEKAFSVVPYGAGFGIRVKFSDFEDVLTLLQPHKREQLIGNTWGIFRLPVAMGEESLQQFLGDWVVHLLHTFRQGFRRI